MLGKLLKYEIPALGRKLAPLYLAWAAASIFLGLASRGVDTASGLFLVISIVAYTAVTTSVMVMALVLIIQRFNQSLLGDGGYFNLILPVSASAHIANKTISAVLWLFISGLAALLSILMIGISGGLDIDWLEFFGSIDGKSAFMCIETIVVVLFSAAKSVLAIYAAISIGHQARSRVTLASIGAYIALMICEGIVGWAGQALDVPIRIGTFAEYQVTMLIGLVVSIALGAVYFMISKILMEKRLNLA